MTDESVSYSDDGGMPYRASLKGRKMKMLGTAEHCKVGGRIIGWVTIQMDAKRLHLSHHALQRGRCRASRWIVLRVELWEGAVICMFRLRHQQPA